MTQPSPLWTRTATRLSGGTGPDAIPVVVAEPDKAPAGTVLLVHGRNGAPEQAQIAEIAMAYLARGWRVVAPELPHSIALPDSGPPDQVTFSGHTRAAATVWEWLARTWPDAPRALAGHSIGAYAIAHLAAAAPDTHHLLAVSPPLSGNVLLNARKAMGPAAIEAVAREAPLFLAEMPVADARAYFNAAANARFFGALPDEHHCPAGAACGQMLSVALAALGV